MTADLVLVVVMLALWRAVSGQPLAVMVTSVWRAFKPGGSHLPWGAIFMTIIILSVVSWLRLVPAYGAGGLDQLMDRGWSELERSECARRRSALSRDPAAAVASCPMGGGRYEVVDGGYQCTVHGAGNR